jgi:hypothetical protein
MNVLKSSIKIIFLIAILSASSLSSSAQDILNPKISFNISFSAGSNIIETNNKSNLLELANISDFVNYNKLSIQNGTSHFVLVSYINESSRNNLFAVNRSALLASVVREHLKKKFGFDNSHFTFTIRFDSEISDLVSIEYKPYSVKSFENQEIHFTQNASYQELVKTISKYREIPFEIHSENALNENNLSEESKFPPSDDTPAINQVPLKNPKQTTTDDKKCRTLDYDEQVYDRDHSGYTKNNRVKNPPGDLADTTRKFHKNIISSIGLKTNLINLAGVTPPAIVTKPVYNISLELYFLKILSASFEGFIAPLLKQSNVQSENWFKVSGASTEIRVWIGQTYRFSGFFVGLYGMYGDFDIRDIKESDKGKTGDFYSTGLSVGFCHPISKKLLVEVGARGGYRKDIWDTYTIINNDFYLSESISKSKFCLTNYNISVIYRFSRKN